MRVEELIDRAVRTVPYYRDRYPAAPERLNDFDVLEKDTVAREQDRLVSDVFERSRLHRYPTSGTTGAPVTLLQDPTERARCAMALWRARRWYGVVSPRQPACRFFSHPRSIRSGVATGPIFRDGATLNLWLNDLSDRAFAAYHAAMVDHRPVWFQAVPSVLGRFASWMIERGLRGPATIRLVELNGEMSLAADRAAIGEAFPSAAIADHYGCAEVWCIAYQCPDGGRHVLEENVRLEVLPSEAGTPLRGEAVVTNLHFSAMPLLRYRLGDVIEIDPSGCRCSRATRTLAGVAGRTVDYGRTLSGEWVYPTFFHLLVDRVNEARAGSIRRFQFVQRGDSLLAQIEPGPGWDSESQSLVAAGVAAKFAGHALDFDLGPIEVPAGRKYRPFLRLDE